MTTTAVVHPPTAAKSGETRIAVFPGRTRNDKPVTVLVKRTETGLVRQTLTHVQLSEERGEIWTMDRWDPTTREKKPVRSITAAGFDRINAFLGVTFIHPDSQTIEDGRVVPNPYSHAPDGDLVYVRVRCIGIGRNAVGNLVCQDLTVIYNLALYFAQDLYVKWWGRKSGRGGTAVPPKEWGTLYDADAVPQESHSDPFKKTVRCPGGIALVVDLKHPEVVSLYQEHVNRIKFADRNALTIARRNILKKFAAAQQVDESLTVPVVSWQQMDRDFQDLATMAAQANEGRLSHEGEDVEIQRATVDASDKDDVDAALAGEVDPDQMTAADDDEPAAGVDVPEPGASGEQDELIPDATKPFTRMPG